MDFELTQFVARPFNATSEAERDPHKICDKIAHFTRERMTYDRLTIFCYPSVNSLETFGVDAEVLEKYLKRTAWNILNRTETIKNCSIPKVYWKHSFDKLQTYGYKIYICEGDPISPKEVKRLRPVKL